MSQTPPDYYDDLDGSLAAAKTIISHGAKDRRSPAHHPVVSTVDAHGQPQQRVMILRAADWENSELRFHTDARSMKVAEVAANARSSLLIYDEPRKIQLRLQGTARIGGKDETDTAWHDSTLFARRCYLADPAPGSASAEPASGLAPDMEGAMPDEDDVAPARENFAILLIAVDSIEWLYLANTGHRRARFIRDTASDIWRSTWLVP